MSKEDEWLLGGLSFSLQRYRKELRINYKRYCTICRSCTLRKGRLKHSNLCVCAVTHPPEFTWQAAGAESISSVSEQTQLTLTKSETCVVYCTVPVRVETFCCQDCLFMWLWRNASSRCVEGERAFLQIWAQRKCPSDNANPDHLSTSTAWIICKVN